MQEVSPAKELVLKLNKLFYGLKTSYKASIKNRKADGTKIEKTEVKVISVDGIS